jgi:hypothetical protein
MRTPRSFASLRSWRTPSRYRVRGFRHRDAYARPCESKEHVLDRRTQARAYQAVASLDVAAPLFAATAFLVVGRPS